MRRLRRFAAVGAAVTAVDVSVLAALAGAGLPPAVADAVALGVAVPTSWALHGAERDDPFARWHRRPGAFLLTALAAAALDVTVVHALAGDGAGGGAVLLAAKALAVVGAGLVRALGYRLALRDVVRRDQACRAERPAVPGLVRLSVVVPAYREADRIADTVGRLRAALAPVAADGGLEVVVVDDGSPDDTAAEARRAGARVVRLERNRGKGAAVRAGVLSATGRTIAFTDADLAYPPEQLRQLLHEVEAGWDVVVGSRRHPASASAPGSGLRQLTGRLFNRLTSAVLLGQYRDTQCGLKAFRGDVARLLFGRSRLVGFAFDVEVLHLVERWRLSLREVPVVLVHPSGSTVRVVVDAARMVRDLFRVRRWGRTGWYDLAPDERVALAGPRQPVLA